MIRSVSSRLVAGLPLALVCLLGTDCPANDDPTWVRFNANDFVEVAVEPREEPGEAVSTDLESTTGAVVVGTATVDPGAAPAGTDHEVRVDIANAYEEIVGKVTVHVDSGTRGEEEFELDRDSADHGAWWLEIRSVGGEDEVRTDRFSIRLWVEEEADAVTDDSGDGA